MKNMSTLTFPDGTQYEILDKKCREEVDQLQTVVAESGSETDKTKISYEVGGDEIEVPTMEEHNQLKDALSALGLSVVDGMICQTYKEG